MGPVASGRGPTHPHRRSRLQHVPIPGQNYPQHQIQDSQGEVMSFRNIDQQNAAIEAAAHEQAKRNTIAYAYQKHPTLVQCDANSRMIVELVERWAGTEVHPSPALFDSMLDENGKDALSMLAQQPVEHTKEQITQE